MVMSGGCGKNQREERREKKIVLASVSKGILLSPLSPFALADVGMMERVTPQTNTHALC